jgi:SAM-dependent methyltransferase
MIKRIIEFYLRTPPELHESTMFCVWQGITRVYHQNLISAMTARDETATENALDEFVTSGGSIGMNHFPESYSMPGGGSDRSHLTNEELFIPDNYTATHNSIVNDADKASSAYPQAALLIRDAFGRVPDRILEIGGGIGFLSVIMYRWGAKLYSDLDIPSNAAVSAFFSARCCRPENVWLYGEAPDHSPKRIRFYPSTEYTAVESDKYDVIFNMNSFPEIPMHIQDAYLALIANCLAPDGVFLSVNHERPDLGQRSVSKAMKNQSRLVCVSSKPSFLLSDYFDEVYKLA